MAVSRKKYQEALKVLKAACKNESLSWTQRIRAAELILCAYGEVDLPWSSKRDRRTVKELTEERAWEKKALEEIRANRLRQEDTISPELAKFLEDD